MKEARKFLVPEYYPAFRCKMGACRHSCCEGWSVTVSLKDYYRLTNLEGSPSLHERIDRALRPLISPTADGYAEISHDLRGICRLRLSDGRCALHAEAGEDALAPLCRLYPRSVRGGAPCECACALSCEETLELLWDISRPLRFIKTELALELPEGDGGGAHIDALGRETALRMSFIAILQDRRYPLNVRLSRLSAAVEEAEAAIEAGDVGRIDFLVSNGLLGDKVRAARPEFSLLALRAAGEFARMLGEHSDGLKEYGERALGYFREGDDVRARYEVARTRFEADFPAWEGFFEHLLVNHLFFSRFPLRHREWNAPGAVYSLLRFLALGCGVRSRDELIDLCHAVFRFIDHTAFDSYAGELLKRLAGEQGENIEDIPAL